MNKKLLIALAEIPDMSLRELRAELQAHGYSPDEIAAIPNWVEAAEMVGKLRSN